MSNMNVDDLVKLLDSFSQKGGTSIKPQFEAGKTNFVVGNGETLSTGVKKSVEELSAYLVEEEHSGKPVTKEMMDKNYVNNGKTLDVLVRSQGMEINIEVNTYYNLDKFTINDVEIELIHTSHDAPASVGFIINYNDIKLC